MSETPFTRSYLEQAGKVIKLSVVFSGTLRWLTIGMGIWLALFLLDNVLNLPAAVRLPLAVAGGGFLLAGFIRNVAIPLFREVSAERTAVILEQSRGVRDNLLINACQLEIQALTADERTLAMKAVDHSASVLSSMPVKSFWERRILVKWSLAAGLLVGVWLAYSLAFPRYTWNALGRYVAPLGDIPPVGSIRLVINPASDVVMNEGADLAVAAVVEREGKETGLDTAPAIVWAEGRNAVAPARNAGETVTMLDDAASGHYRYVFRSVQRSFSFRVLGGDTYSRSVQVTVLPKPRITSSVTRIKPPAYTGLAVMETPGPPAPVSCLPMSELEVQAEFDQSVESVTWNFAKTGVAFSRKGKIWTAHTILTNTGPYTIDVMNARNGLSVPVAAGEVQLETDRPPEVEFVTENRNLFVAPGTRLALTLRAADDYGISNLVVTCSPSDDFMTTNDVRLVNQWTYSGPPGNRGPVRESFSLALAPQSFTPGGTYLLEAAGWDFRPGTKPGKSKPIVLRIKALSDLTLPVGDVLSDAMNLLKRTIAKQKKANETTDNLRANLDEARQAGHIATHRDAMRDHQEEAVLSGRQAVEAFRRFPAEGRLFSDRLAVLVDDEMGLALQQISGLKADPGKDPSVLLDKLSARQDYILNELIALLGSVFNERSQKDKKADQNNAKDVAVPPTVHDDKAASLSDDLKAFERAQKQIIKNSRDLMDKRPEDLTKDAKEEIAGALAREEAEWAKFLEEKLTDFAKLPLQDFSDASAARQLNEVIQDVDKAAEALYKQKTELAVPMEQSGLEKAEELVNNLEKWLSNKPDNVKWSMEEPANPADIPMAELPAELEDIVGELLDKEEEMQQDVEDVSSSWMDSIDKGAGWGTGDGPISSMSAKGVTGNLLPNKQEIGGRSGEGRSGKSNGQMVQDSAEGKGGRETPTRLSPSPFEPGNVKDSQKTDSGGATGGGKLSGFGEKGLRGPTTPPPEKMARIAGGQAKIRQEAEALALKLRKYKLPSGDLEASIAAMKKVEVSAQRQDGMTVRRSYNGALDSLVDARKGIRAEVGVHRERSKLPDSALREIMTGLQESMPKGYEELVSDYFRRMAGDAR